MSRAAAERSCQDMLAGLQLTAPVQSEEVIPLRPGYGKAGRGVKLLANFFKAQVGGEAGMG